VELMREIWGTKRGGAVALVVCMTLRRAVPQQANFRAPATRELTTRYWSGSLNKAFGDGFFFYETTTGLTIPRPLSQDQSKGLSHAI
jgi:hypothetical protein